MPDTVVNAVRLWVIIAASFLLACADQGFLDRSQINSSIINGESADWSDPLAQTTVMIARDVVFKKGVPQFLGPCTGVILSPRLILTAGHCVSTNFSSHKVIYSPKPRNVNPVDYYNVKAVHHHPTYNFFLGFQSYKKSLNHLTYEFVTSYLDAALVELDRDIPVNKMALDLTNSLNTPIKFKTGLISGFGKTSHAEPGMIDSAVSGELRKAQIQVTWKSESGSHIVVEQKRDKPAVCVGDSGGPLFGIDEGGQPQFAGIAVAVFQDALERDYLVTFDSESTRINTCVGYGLFLNFAEIQPWVKETKKKINQLL